MVALAGRITALWLVSLMVTSTFVLVAPTAIAAPSPTFETPNILINGADGWKDYSRTDPIVPDRVISIGDRVMFHWNVTWPDGGTNGNCISSGPLTTRGEWRFLNAAGDLTFTNLGVLTGTTPTASVTLLGRRAEVKLDVTAVATTAGEDGDAKVAANFRFTCVDLNGEQNGGTVPGDNSDAPTFVPQQSEGFHVDTVRPVIPEPTISRVHGSARARDASGTILGTEALMEIGSTFSFTPTATDANGVELEWNLNALRPTATWEAIPVGGARSVVIEEEGTNGWASFNDQTGAVELRAKDTHGNEQTRTVSLNRIDNVRPGTSAEFVLNPSHLTRTPASAVAKIHLTTAASVPFTQIARVGGGAIVNVTSTPSDAITIPLALADPLTTPIQFVVHPIDAAGNINTSVTRTTAFPTGITVTFGNQPTAPPTLGDGNFRDVFVTVDENWPDLPWSSPQDRLLYGQLMRKRAGGAQSFWEVGTAGTDPSTATAGHFQASPVLDPTASPTTVFQQPIGTSENETGTSARSYRLTNLSGKALVDGHYELWLNLSSPNGGHRLQYVVPVAVDKRDPLTAAHKNYSRAPWPTAGQGFGPNMTDVHGADGNIVRVLYWGNDTWTHESHGPMDSGLRNVTMELVDMSASTVVRRGNGELARLDVTPTTCNDVLPYCVELVPPTSACPTSTPTAGDVLNHTGCAWLEIVSNSRFNTTFMNQTTFAGWFNITHWTDLPSGKFKVRVLAWDNAGRLKASLYGSDAAPYTVAPAVRASSEDGGPRINDDGTISVTALASERRAAGSTGCAVAPAPTTVCPAGQVRAFVSNTNGVNEVGTELPISLTDSAINGAPQSVTTNGWLTLNTLNGTPEFKDGLTLWGFPYRFVNVQLPSSVDATKDVYVKLQAISVDGNGNEVTKSTTGWIKTASALAPALAINAPAACDLDKIGLPQCDWPLNLSGQLPNFNVSFDRKTESGNPRILYWINTSSHDIPSDGVTASFNGSETPPLKSGVADPRFKFNWTGRLNLSNGAALPAGSYKFHVLVHENGVKLAETDRFFTILATAPSITTETLTVGAVQRGSIVYVAPTFEVPFYVEHGGANLTSVDQLEFKLVRGIVRPGQSREISEGTDGFDVFVREDTLDASHVRTNFTAFVTMPDGIVNHDPFHLNITAKVDPQPYRVGNATKLLPLVLDRQPPGGTLLVTESENTVFDAPTASTVPRNRASPAPKFLGFTEDLGAGVQKVEVRIFDVTRNQTVRIGGGSMSGASFGNGVTEDWVDSSVSPNFITLDAADGNGRRAWSIPLTDRPAGLPDLWHPTSALSVINLSHTYRIDVRVTDALGQVGAINSTTFDFDAASPTLGYANRLGTTSTMKSGIESSLTRMSWHGSALLSVNVTDNQCIRAVRLVGVHETTPETQVRANMSPVGVPANTRLCYENFPQTHNGAKFVRYQIDLLNAPQMSDVIGNYTYWYEVEDEAGQVGEIPTNFRTFRMEVVDNSPATILGSPSAEPDPGQAGGRTLVRADVFDNLAVDHVVIEFRDLDTNVLLASGTMRYENETGSVGGYVADTQDDLALDLEVRDYLVNITPYDVNWNRSQAAGGPTCPAGFCLGTTFIYRVRDDGPPATVLESPSSGATVNATPTFKLRALHKNLDTSGVTIVAGVDGNETTLNETHLQFTELTSSNGTRQGWSVVYEPGTLEDGANLTLNVTLNVGGLTNVSSYSFRVDALPPTVSANLTGTVTLANKTWAVATTQIEISAADSVSSTTRYYSVNGGAQQTYSSPITPSGDDGEWTLEYWAADAAGNVAARESLTLSVDRTGPRISVAKHGDEVLLTVTDAGVGLNESSVVVHYRYGEAISFTPKTLDKVAGNSFSTLLPGNATEAGLAYYFVAQDLLGNVGSNFTVQSPYVIPKGGGNGTPPTNLPPTISITAPSAGSSQRGVFDLKWLAEDPEGEALSITIALRDPAPGKVISAGGDNSGTYRLNLSGSEYPAGAYTLVVTASDGVNSASDTVTFNLESGNAIKPISVPPPNVQANQQVNIGVSIEPAGKTVTQASYRVIKDGQLYTSGRLTAASGAYGAVFTPTEPGNYRVLIDVAYSDGSTDASQQVAAFTVGGGASTIAKVFPASLMALVAIAGITAALAAYGAFGRWRK